MTSEIPFSESNKVELDYATVFLRKDGIVNTDIQLKSSISLQQAKELLDAYLIVGNGTKKPHLFTLSKFVIPDNDVLVFLRNVANEKGIADAFVIQSLPQRIIGNFYLKFFKPVIPVKLFTNQEKAISWLNQYLK